jgi:hypothetical protein
VHIPLEAHEFFDYGRPQAGQPNMQRTAAMEYWGIGVLGCCPPNTPRKPPNELKNVVRLRGLSILL